MRCFFDGKLKSQDTVMMNLYKRIFPKWSYQSRVRAPAPLIDYKPAKRKRESESMDIFGGKPTSTVLFRTVGKSDDADMEEC